MYVRRNWLKIVWIYSNRHVTRPNTFANLHADKSNVLKDFSSWRPYSAAYAVLFVNCKQMKSRKETKRDQRAQRRLNERQLSETILFAANQHTISEK
jgi:hypothetical protein